jgi:hypothetical protein
MGTMRGTPTPANLNTPPSREGFGGGIDEELDGVRTFVGIGQIANVEVAAKLLRAKMDRHCGSFCGNSGGSGNPSTQARRRRPPVQVAATAPDGPCRAEGRRNRLSDVTITLPRLRPKKRQRELDFPKHKPGTRGPRGSIQDGEPLTLGYSVFAPSSLRWNWLLGTGTTRAATAGRRRLC